MSIGRYVSFSTIIQYSKRSRAFILKDSNLLKFSCVAGGRLVDQRAAPVRGARTDVWVSFVYLLQ
jgi:hypothetical protein